MQYVCPLPRFQRRRSCICKSPCVSCRSWVPTWEGGIGCGGGGFVARHVTDHEQCARQSITILMTWPRFRRGRLLVSGNRADG